MSDFVEGVKWLGASTHTHRSYNQLCLGWQVHKHNPEPFHTRTPRDKSRAKTKTLIRSSCFCLADIPHFLLPSPLPGVLTGYNGAQLLSPCTSSTPDVSVSPVSMFSMMALVPCSCLHPDLTLLLHCIPPSCKLLQLFAPPGHAPCGL